MLIFVERLANLKSLLFWRSVCCVVIHWRRLSRFGSYPPACESVAMNR